MQAERDMQTLIKHDERRTVQNDRSKKVLRNETTDIGGNRTETVKLNETITIGGQPRQATKVVNVSGHREMLVWVVEGLPLPARLLQRKNGKDEIDLRITSVR